MFYNKFSCKLRILTLNSLHIFSNVTLNLLHKSNNVTLNSLQISHNVTLNSLQITIFALFKLLNL